MSKKFKRNPKKRNRQNNKGDDYQDLLREGEKELQRNKRRKIDYEEGKKSNSYGGRGRGGYRGRGRGRGGRYNNRPRKISESDKVVLKIKNLINDNTISNSKKKKLIKLEKRAFHIPGYDNLREANKLFEVLKDLKKGEKEREIELKKKKKTKKKKVEEEKEDDDDVEMTEEGNMILKEQRLELVKKIHELLQSNYFRFSRFSAGMHTICAFIKFCDNDEVKGDIFEEFTTKTGLEEEFEGSEGTIAPTLFQALNNQMSRHVIEGLWNFHKPCRPEIIRILSQKENENWWWEIVSNKFSSEIIEFIYTNSTTAEKNNFYFTSLFQISLDDFFKGVKFSKPKIYDDLYKKYQNKILYFTDFIEFKKLAHEDKKENKEEKEEDKENKDKYLDLPLTVYTKKVKKLVDKVVEKGLLKNEYYLRLMYDYFSVLGYRSDIRGYIDELVPEIIQFMHLKDGAKLSVFLIAYASPKQRKKFIKESTELIADMIVDQYGWLVITFAFLAIDDTVLINDKLIKPLVQDQDTFDELMHNKYFQRVLLFLMSPFNKKYFQKDQIEIVQPPKLRRIVDYYKTNDEDKEIKVSKKNTNQIITTNLERFQDALFTFFEDQDNLLYIIKGIPFLVNEFMKKEDANPKIENLHSNIFEILKNKETYKKHVKRKLCDTIFKVLLSSNKESKFANKLAGMINNENIKTYIEDEDLILLIVGFLKNNDFRESFLAKAKPFEKEIKEREAKGKGFLFLSKVYTGTKKQ